MPNTRVLIRCLLSCLKRTQYVPNTSRFESFVRPCLLCFTTLCWATQSLPRLPSEVEAGGALSRRSFGGHPQGSMWESRVVESLAYCTVLCLKCTPLFFLIRPFSTTLWPTNMCSYPSCSHRQVLLRQFPASLAKCGRSLKPAQSSCHFQPSPRLKPSNLRPRP